MAGPERLAASPPPGARTSENNPIEVGWIDFSQVPDLPRPEGRLGMTFLPGKRHVGIAGHHWRDLELDAARLREVHGVDTLMLLVEDHELATFGVPDILEVARSHGIAVLRYPVVDGGVPADTSRLRRLLEDIAGWLAEGDRVVVACRGGLGRTGTFVALVLRGLGLDAATAIAVTRTGRHSTIENAAQEAFVAGWVPRSSSTALPFDQ